MDTEQNNQAIPWVEKYRPTEFDTIVLDPTNKILFEQILQKGYFPNLLFYGPPGTGKTTTIINLIQEYQSQYTRINRSNVIHLNASDDRGIDIIRNQIQSFVRSNNLFETGFKFVVLDEVDYMTKNAQQALKYLIQTTTTNVRFCLICNYISKIDNSLKSEFITVRFNQLPKSEIRGFIRMIAEKEGMQINDHAIDIIQEMYNSDIRSMINFLQLNQNFQLREWNSRIISNAILEELHNTVVGSCTNKELLYYIHNISSQYNLDKNKILLLYFNYIIRSKEECVTHNILIVMQNIIHNTHTIIEDNMNYFISHRSYLHNNTICSSDSEHELTR
jgi:DNA polymerase III delta prime subunit